MTPYLVTITISKEIWGLGIGPVRFKVGVSGQTTVMYVCMYKFCCKCRLDGDLEARLYGSPPEPLLCKRKWKVTSMMACEVSLEQVSRVILWSFLSHAVVIWLAQCSSSTEALYLYHANKWMDGQCHILSSKENLLDKTCREKVCKESTVRSFASKPSVTMI